MSISGIDSLVIVSYVGASGRAGAATAGAAVGGRTAHKTTVTISDEGRALAARDAENPAAPVQPPAEAVEDDVRRYALGPAWYSDALPVQFGLPNLYWKGNEGWWDIPGVGSGPTTGGENSTAVGFHDLQDGEGSKLYLRGFELMRDHRAEIDAYMQRMNELYAGVLQDNGVAGMTTDERYQALFLDTERSNAMAAQFRQALAADPLIRSLGTYLGIAPPT